MDGEGLIATVTVVFDGAEQASPAAIADALMERDDVMTVRVGGPGAPSVYRADVPGAGAAAEDAATRAAHAVAEELGARASVVSVALTADRGRTPELP